MIRLDKNLEFLELALERTRDCMRPIEIFVLFANQEVIKTIWH